MNLVKQETYRSQPEVNKPDDMIRVVIDMPLWEWRKVKKALKKINEKHN